MDKIVIIYDYVASGAVLRIFCFDVNMLIDSTHLDNNSDMDGHSSSMVKYIYKYFLETESGSSLLFCRQ